MHAKKLVVIVCDNIEQFEEKYKKVKSQCHVLCLTKNVELFLMGTKSYENIEIRIFEGQKNYLDYAEQTWDILDEINACIAQTLTDRIYLYQMNCHLEGKSEAMQITKILMYNDLFDEFFRQYEDVRVHCCYNVVYTEEIEYLYFWCKKNKKKFSVDFSKSKWNFTKLRIYILSKLGENVFDVMWESYAFFYNKSKIAKIKRSLKHLKEEAAEQQYSDIGIIKGSAFEKDYNWTKGYLDLLSEAGIGFRFICVNEKDRKWWESFGYKADNMMGSLRIDILINELNHYKSIKKKIWNVLERYLSASTSTNDMAQLKWVIKNFLRYTTVDSIIKDVAANEFFKTHHYKIIDLHSNTNSMLSKVCSFNAKKYSDIVKIRNCTGTLLSGKALYYEPYGYLSDFGLLSKERESGQSTVERHRTEYVGRKYEVKNTTYSKDFYQNSFNPDSLKKDLCILWAPSCPCIGSISYKNFLKTGLTLIDFFEKNSGKFIMKFHPRQRESEINIFKERGKENSNISLETSAANIREVLDRVDILITNCSASFMDAVIKRKAVICVVCEYEYQKIELYKEGLCIIKNDADLDALLLQLEDETYRKQWIAERIRKQDAYFATLIGNEEERKKILSIIKQELS